MGFSHKNVSRNSILDQTSFAGLEFFYKDIKSCVINNGLTSNFFPLERGVRQGDPLSPYLFVIAVETLAIAIRQDPDIKGIVIGKEGNKSSAICR